MDKIDLTQVGEVLTALGCTEDIDKQKIELSRFGDLNVEVDTLSAVVMAMNRTVHRNIIAIETMHAHGFDALVDEWGDFESALHVDRKFLQYDLEWRYSRDTEKWQLVLEAPNGTFSFPMVVSLYRTPGIDNSDYCSDDCWCSSPYLAPAREHDEQCEFRKWIETTTQDRDWDNAPDCECDFECMCEPAEQLLGRVTLKSSDEMFGGGFNEWLNQMIKDHEEVKNAD